MNPLRTRRAPVVLIAFGAFAALAAPAAAYVGQWHSYTDKSRVTALIEHDGFVYAGTQGGIRRIHPGTLAQRDFSNLDGLIDPWITGFAHDGDGTLWAAALDGYVYALAKGGTRWEISGRAYAAEQWKMNPRAVLGAGTHLYLGSVKGLAVFDTRQKISQLNVTRFGNDLDVQVLSLLRRGDTLYVGTSAGVYKAPVHFADPLNPPAGSANLADHAQWIKVSLAPDPNRKYNHLAFIGDSLATYGPGTLLQAPGDAALRIEAFSGSPLSIAGQAYPSSWNDYTSAVMAGGKVFAGGNSGLAVAADPVAAPLGAAPLAPLHLVARDTIANIGANGGRIWGHSPAGLHLFNAATGDFTASPVPMLYSIELYGRSLRNVKVSGNADVYVGTWGAGVVRVRGEALRAWPDNNASAGDSCVARVVPNYPVVYALSPPHGKALYFSMFLVEGSPEHQLVYLDTESEQLTCLSGAVPGGYPHALQAFGDTLLGIATDRGVNFLVVREGVFAPSVESSTLWTLPGAANEAWDLAADGWGRPWALIGDRLAYLDSLGLSSGQKLKPIETFTGTNCKSLEADPAGSLWVGCGNGLFHVQTDPGGTVTSTRRYGLDDGLPSLVLYDLTVDSATGRVWVATDRGVAMFESPSQPPIPRGQLAVITPYPNPFRPQHAFVIFDKLPPNSTLRIHDPSGHVVRTIPPRELTGNQAQWDGKNESGRAVMPGVYLFSVTSGSTVQRGKVIVAR